MKSLLGVFSRGVGGGCRKVASIFEVIDELSSWFLDLTQTDCFLFFGKVVILDAETTAFFRGGLVLTGFCFLNERDCSYSARNLDFSGVCESVCNFCFTIWLLAFGRMSDLGGMFGLIEKFNFRGVLDLDARFTFVESFKLDVSFDFIGFFGGTFDFGFSEFFDFVGSISFAGSLDLSGRFAFIDKFDCGGMLVFKGTFCEVFDLSLIHI